MPDPTVLVTGAGGFVGRSLIRLLAESPRRHRVVGVDLAGAPADSAGWDEWHVLDLVEPAAVRDLIGSEQPACVYHLGGLARGSDTATLYAANVRTTVVLLEALEDARTQTVTVIPGSAAEYGPAGPDRLPIVETEPLRPNSRYGVSKAQQTAAALSFVARGLDVRIARLFNLIGPGLPASFAFGAFGRQLVEVAAGRQAPVLSTGYLGSRRDFLDIRDVAAGLVSVAQAGSTGETYNVCSGTGTSMRDCLDMLIAASGLDVVVESANANDPGAILDSVGSNAKARRELGWGPQITLDQSIIGFWADLSAEASG